MRKLLAQPGEEDVDDDELQAGAVEPAGAHHLDAAAPQRRGLAVRGRLAQDIPTPSLAVLVLSAIIACRSMRKSAKFYALPSRPNWSGKDGQRQPADQG